MSRGIRRFLVAVLVAGGVSWFALALSMAGVVQQATVASGAGSIPSDVQQRYLVAIFHMSELVSALSSYAYDNNNRLPSSLTMLYPEYISDPKIFWHPGDSDPAPTTINNDNLNQPNSTRISFQFTSVANWNDLCDGDPIVWDNSPQNNAGLFVTAYKLSGDVAMNPPLLPVSPWPKSRARSNLSTLALGLLLYTYDNNGDFPQTLSQLHPQYVPCPTKFWNPGDSDPEPTQITNSIPNAMNSSQVSFAYLGTGRSDESRLDVILLDNSLANNPDGGLVAATSTGQAQVFEKSTRFLPTTVTARSNLQQIGAALLMYATNNKNLFPPKLSMLYPGYISNPAVFWNPGDHDAVPTTINNDTPNQSNSAQISYRYLGADYTAACHPGTVLVADSSLSNNGGTGMNILIANGSADYYAPALPTCPFAGACARLPSSNLRRIGFALYSYANEHFDDLPPNLSVLHESGLLPDPMTFWHPGDSDPAPLTIDNDSPNQNNSSQISFEYLGAGRKLSTIPLSEILVRDNSLTNNGGRGINALYADCHTEFLPSATLTSLTITSGPAAVPEASFGHYTCMATYSDGWTMDVTSHADWSIADGPGAMGWYTYVAPLTILADTPVTLRASYEDYFSSRPITLQAEKTITVQNSIRIPNALSITSGPATVNEGSTGSYVCMATFDDGSVQNVTSAATWTVVSGPGSFPTPGTFSASATVTVDTPATLHVSYTEGGATKEATKTITVKNTARSLSGVAITSGPDSVNEGGTGVYICTATFDQVVKEDVTAAATWAIVIGPGTFTAKGTYAAPPILLADAPITIRATYTADGVTRQAEKIITIKNSSRILTAISITTGPTNVPEGGTGAFTCTAAYDDGSTQNVTAAATWSVVTGGGSFLTAGSYAAPAAVLADVIATIRVGYTEGGISKWALNNFTIKNSTHAPTGLAITAGPTTLQAGTTASFAATATFDDGTTEVVTTTCTWSVVSGPGSFSTAGMYAAPVSVTTDTTVVIKARYTEAGASTETTRSIVITPPPADTDGDGVPDNKDLCPGTADGANVNADGCSIAQTTDTDGDGIVDTQDECPADPAKIVPGLCGCGQADTVGCNSQFTLRITSNLPLATGDPAPQLHAAGTYVDVHAPPAPDGYHFDQWSGDATGQANPISVVMTRDMIIQANYVADPAAPAPIQPRFALCGAGAPAGLLVAGLGLMAMRIARRRQD